MPDEVFIAINGDALHAKSKVYIGRALTRNGAGDLDEYQLWASLALELLGKAALARRHSSLVVDPTHWQSMFVAAGINVTTDVKTIAARSEEHTSELQSLMRISYAVFCLKKKK